MSKVVKVQNGDYKIITQQTGTITLDTGNQVGQVIVTGDLVVQGNTTTVESETLTIRDRIIDLNVDDPGPGVTLNTAGISIKRGSAVAVNLFFDEVTDTFRFIDDSGNLIPLTSNSIITNNTDLLINTGTLGNGVISVTGVPNYESRCSDPDDIPNLQYLFDYVSAVGGSALVDRFFAFTTSGGSPTALDTGAIAFDTDDGAAYSRVSFQVDGSVISEIKASGLLVNGSIEIDDIEINDNYIRTVNSNTNLELRASGTGVVLIDDTLGLSDQVSAPSAAAGQTKIYSSGTVGTGGTGVYFANTSQTGELISSKKALLYALLF